MIPVKIQCGCGQRYAFDVEPVRGQVPAAVAYPVCGADGTPAANAAIAQAVPVPPVISAAPVMAVSIGAAPYIALPPRGNRARKQSGEYSLGMGVLGAFMGAAAGVGAMYAFYSFAGFRFPLLGVGIGFLTGIGAKMLGKGTSNELGAIAGGIALVSVVRTLYLMYGVFPIISIVSVVVSVSFAYRAASG